LTNILKCVIILLNKILKEINNMERPKIIDNIDLDKLKKLCEEYMNDVEKGYVDEDYSNWFFETVMFTFYGREVFKFINEKLK
jgi:hypothetical protein